MEYLRGVTPNNVFSNEFELVEFVAFHFAVYIDYH